MGNDCLASTPIEHYQSYFDLKVSEIKDYWTTIQVYKIKKLFDSKATKHPQFSKQTHIEFQKFFELFPEMESLPQKQKLRIFEIFNFDGHGFVDWDNFYSMISICYFCKEETLATLMFMIFDESLSKEINEAELQLLCQHTEDYFMSSEEQGEEQALYSYEEIMERLLNGKKDLSLQTWLQLSPSFFNFIKFRKMFNIFVEEKLEKELIKHFNEWNNLYVENEDRYVSYLINFKWFQTWKIYVKQQYGVVLNCQAKKPTTFKTKKIFNSMGKMKKKNKVANLLTFRELKLKNTKKKSIKLEEVDSEDEIVEQLKNFDFIHSNIGENPYEINNKVLEGDYEEVLNQEIIENRDYVLISEKVWKHLSRIYDGYPEFRRTGEDFIELYPKIIKTLCYNGRQIEYDESLKQISAYYYAQDILTTIFEGKCENTAFYYKTIGMDRWKQIADDEQAIGELSNEIIIFIVSVDQKIKVDFEKKFIHSGVNNIMDIQVGDQILYDHPVKKMEIKMIFLGKNSEGKYILHFPGESYIYNLCVMESELLRKGKLMAIKGEKQLEMVKPKNKEDLALIGIPNSKGLGFINSVILALSYNWPFKQQLSMFIKKQIVEEEDMKQLSILQTLAIIFKNLTYKQKVNTKLIHNMINQHLQDFSQFSSDMCKQFMSQFLAAIQEELEEKELKDHISNYSIKTLKKRKCLKCNTQNEEEENQFILSVPLLPCCYKYYEIIYVPFSDTIKVCNMKRYGFKLKVGASLKDYREAFEKVAEINREENQYLLMQVYANNIIKNYSTAKDEATLDQLLLRNTDIIYAYELKTDFTDFIKKHYKQNVNYENKEVKIDQFIDCKNSKRGWIFGKVCEKDFNPYGHRMMIRVIHKFSKGEHWEISYDVEEDTVANFPTKSFLNGEQYHLKLLQRYFNEASNDMQICNTPLVCVLTNWMRWKEFYYLIYLQMKRFIKNDQKEFNDDESGLKLGIPSSKSIPKNTGKSGNNKVRLNNFKDYLYGSEFPYRLFFVDYSGRCAICFKFLKTSIFQGEESTYCSGCELSSKEPISWQIKVSDVMVCVDWKGLDLFKKNIVKDHISYDEVLTESFNDIERIEDCVSLLDRGYSEPLEQLCCNVETETLVSEKIIEYPENLNIYIERIVEENNFINIIKKNVKFQEELNLNGHSYQLIGVTSIDGDSNQSNKFRVFIRISQNQWLEYDGNMVRRVKKSIIDKLVILNLYYKKKGNKMEEKGNQGDQGSNDHQG